MTSKENTIIYFGIGAIIFYFLLKIKSNSTHEGPQFIPSDSGLSKDITSAYNPNGIKSNAIVDTNIYNYTDKNA